VGASPPRHRPRSRGLLWRRPGLRAGLFEFFKSDTDCLFGVSARAPRAGFDCFSTRPWYVPFFILVVFVIIAESNLILHAPQHGHPKSHPESLARDKVIKAGLPLKLAIVIFKSLFNSRGTKIAHPNTVKSFQLPTTTSTIYETGIFK
jgi:hypothetical protein